jgi:uncharacterized HAD superfamily protein
MVDKYNRCGEDHPGVISRAQLTTCPYDLAVEDSLDTALFLSEQMGVTVLLYDRPWNARPAAPSRVIRVASWQDIGALPWCP